MIDFHSIAVTISPLLQFSTCASPVLRAVGEPGLEPGISLVGSILLAPPPKRRGRVSELVGLLKTVLQDGCGYQFRHSPRCLSFQAVFVAGKLGVEPSHACGLWSSGSFSEKEEPSERAGVCFRTDFQSAAHR